MKWPGANAPFPRSLINFITCLAAQTFLDIWSERVIIERFVEYIEKISSSLKNLLIFLLLY